MAAQTVAPPVSPVAPFPPEMLAPPKMSVAEYLARERVSEIRHEYVEGELIAMAGETPNHNVIAGNVYTCFVLAFAERDCTAYFEGIRLRVSPTRYRYPDVMAVCGNAQFDNENPPALLNPGVIVEVLSSSTQGMDHNEKWDEYRRLPGLTDYALVAQDHVSVTHCVRQGIRQWQVIEYIELTDILNFTSLAVTLTVADIYRKITFPVSELPVTAE